jgi:hypothetical protein
MGQIILERYDDFTGGLNLRADQFLLARNESPDMMNVEIDPRGGLFSRGAMQQLNTTAVGGTWAPKRLHAFYGATSTIMLANSTKVLRSTGANFSTLAFSLGNDIVASNTHGAEFANWGSTLYMTTGASGVAGYKWETTSTFATALTVSVSGDWQTYVLPEANHMPKAEHLIVHANKMFVANTNENGTAFPDRVRWSHEGLPEDWMEDDYIDVIGGGSGINALSVVQGQLVIFKTNAIYLLVGTESANFAIVELTQNLGASSPNGVATAEQGVFFYSMPEGLFYYNGSSVEDIFKPLRPIVDDKLLSLASTEPYSVSYVGRRVWLALPFDADLIATKPTVNFVFDPTINRTGAYMQFATHDGYGVIAGTNWSDSNNDNFRLMIHPYQAFILKVDIYDEQQDNISGTLTGFASHYRTGWVDGKTYAQKKMFRRPDIAFKQADTTRTVAVKVFHNYEETLNSERKSFNIVLSASSSASLWGSAVWGTSLWGNTSKGVQVQHGSNLGLARSVQMLFTGPLSNEWGIDSIAYKYNNRRMTG